MTVSGGLPLQNEPISQLPTAGTLTGAELTVIVQNGVTSQTTLALVNTIPVAGGSVPTSRAINTSPPLHGGGPLTGDLSLTIDATGLVINVSQLVGILPVANGGTGTATPAVTAGSGISVTGTWPNLTIASLSTGGTVTSITAGTGLSGGVITGTGTIALAAIASATVLGNSSGGSAVPSSTTVTALLDAAIGSTQGSIIYRNASAWVALPPGTAGNVLTTGGAAANPSWTASTALNSPGGRLSVQSRVPVPVLWSGGNGDGPVYATSTLYYMGYVSNGVPYYNGSIDLVDAIPSGQVSVTMATSGAGVLNSDGVFDIFWDAVSHSLVIPTNGAGGGWVSDTATATATGNTHTSTLVDGFASSVIDAGWWPGMGIAESHGDIPDGTTIDWIGVDGKSVVLSAAATASHTGGTITVTGATNQTRGFGYSQVHNTRGYWTNVNAITTAYNGASNLGPFAADRLTYLGSVYTTSAGTTQLDSQSFAAGGHACFVGIWNAYNREEINVGTLTTNAVNITGSTETAYDASTNMRVSWVDGLMQSNVKVGLQVFIGQPSGSSVRIGEGLDWVSGAIVGNETGGDGTALQVYLTQDTHVPKLGLHYIQMVQRNVGTGTAAALADGGIAINTPY